MSRVLRVYFPTPAGRDVFLAAVADAQIQNPGRRDSVLVGFTESGQVVRVEHRPNGERAVEIEVIRE